MSKGQTQRLCLGRALLHDPQILILDEPAAGLDPKARVELKNLIRILAQEGKTILISSHTVSYTHLDVYKRQLKISPRRSAALMR